LSQSNALRRAGLSPAAAVLVREVGGEGPLPVRVKALPLRLVGTRGLDRATSTAGGVALGEVDAGFMLRRRVGVFVCGEMLDWKAPTGGYLLQGAFSTGWAVGEGALGWFASKTV
jgi:predicted flavoprotein YhiN